MTKEANTKLPQLFGTNTESKCSVLVTLDLNVNLLIFIIFFVKKTHSFKKLG